MDDPVQTAPDEVQDSPTDAAPTEVSPQDGPQPIVDWRKRAEDNQAWATRQAQENATLREQVAAFEASQQEPDDDEYEDYEDFEDSVARQELAQIKALLAERDQQASLERQQAEESSHIDSELEAIEKETQDELSQDESDWIGNYALTHRGENGKPDVRLAYQTYIDLIEGRKSKWISTKKAPRPGTGAAAKEKVNLDDPAQRREYVAQRLTELEDS